jgi:Antitoxin VbhA
MMSAEPSLSSGSRAYRESVPANARASVELEGLDPAAAEPDVQAYVRGEITVEETVQRVLDRMAARYGPAQPSEGQVARTAVMQQRPARIRVHTPIAGPAAPALPLLQSTEWLGIAYGHRRERAEPSASGRLTRG